MRILIENNFYYPNIYGGAEISTQLLAEELARRGHEVSVITTGVRSCSEQVNGILVYYERLHAPLSYQEHLNKHNRVEKLLNKPFTIYNPLNELDFNNIINKTKPEVVITANLLGVTTAIWSTCNRKGIPVAHITRDASLLCPNSTMICHKRSDCTNANPVLPCSLIRTLNRKQSNLVSAVISPSKYMLDLHVRYGLFCRAVKRVISNAIVFDSNDVESRIPYRKNKRKNIKFIYLGRLTYEKGVDLILDSMKRLSASNIELHIAGDGPMRPIIEEAERVDHRIRYHGFIKGNQLDSALIASDVLIAPSRMKEAFGRIVLDAYKFGLPVIAARSGGLSENVNDKTGCLFTPGDATGLTRAMQEYIDKPELLVKHSLAALKAVERFTLENQAKEFENVLGILQV